jgi:hypothetical protein
MENIVFAVPLSERRDGSTVGAAAYKHAGQIEMSGAADMLKACQWSGEDRAMKPEASTL